VSVFYGPRWFPGEFDCERQNEAPGAKPSREYIAPISGVKWR